MVSAFDRQDLGPACGPPGQFHRAFDSFCATVDEVHRIESGALETREQARRRPVLGLLGVFAVDHHVQVPVQLLLQGAPDGRVAVPQRAHTDAADHVEQPLTGFRFHPAPLSAHDALTKRVGGCHGESPVEEMAVVTHGTGSASNSNSSANTHVGFQRPRCHSGISPPLNWLSSTRTYRANRLPVCSIRFVWGA